MANRVADRIGDRDITHIVSSPLERAQETATPLAAARGLTVELDERVIESGNVFEGKPFDVRDSILRQPEIWRTLWNPFRPSWGEPYKQVVARMWPAVLDAREDAQSATRPWSSPTSCRSGSPGCTPRDGASCTTPASGTARCAA